MLICLQTRGDGALFKLICIVSFQLRLSLGDKSKHIDNPSFDFRGVKLVYFLRVPYTFTGHPQHHDGRTGRKICS